MQYNIIPLVYKGKNPLDPWKALQTRKLTPAEWDALYQKVEEHIPFNTGMICGAISENVIHIDLDYPALFGYLELDHLKQQTWVFRSSIFKKYPKIHIVFQITDGTIESTTFADGLGEIKGDKTIAVMPPSLHASGTHYTTISETNIPQKITKREFLGIVKHIETKIKEIPWLYAWMVAKIERWRTLKNQKTKKEIETIKEVYVKELQERLKEPDQNAARIRVLQDVIAAYDKKGKGGKPRKKAKTKDHAITPLKDTAEGAALIERLKEDDRTINIPPCCLKLVFKLIQEGFHLGYELNQKVFGHYIINGFTLAEIDEIAAYDEKYSSAKTAKYYNYCKDNYKSKTGCDKLRHWIEIRKAMEVCPGIINQ